jgi:hypothetical protein
MLPLQMSTERQVPREFMANVLVDDDGGEIFPPGRRGASERGRRLFFERYGCASCPSPAAAATTVRRWTTPAKLRSGWIAWWLQGPQRWRADVRCPDFGMDADDARDWPRFSSRRPVHPTAGTP